MAVALRNEEIWLCWLVRLRLLELGGLVRFQVGASLVFHPGSELAELIFPVAELVGVGLPCPIREDVAPVARVPCTLLKELPVIFAAVERVGVHCVCYFLPIGCIRN